MISTVAPTAPQPTQASQASTAPQAGAAGEGSGFAQLLGQARQAEPAAPDEAEAAAPEPRAAAASHPRNGAAAQRAEAASAAPTRPAAEARAAPDAETTAAPRPEHDTPQPGADEDDAAPADLAALLAQFQPSALRPQGERAPAHRGAAAEAADAAATTGARALAGKAVARAEAGAAADGAVGADDQRLAAAASFQADKASAQTTDSASATIKSEPQRGFAAELAAALPAAAAPAPAASAGADASAPTQGHLSARPGSAEFAQQLGTQISTFVREGVQHARLELHPVEMGPLTVQIQLDGQAAQVNLVADNADTRQALQQAMPQLAGSLRQAGLTLSGGGVFEQPRQNPGSGPGDGPRRGSGRSDATRAVEAPPARALRRRGVVDLVA